MGAFSLVSIYRAIHFAISGFFIPDEYAYLYFHLSGLDYQGRWFFNLVNLAWFGWTKGNVNLEILVMPFYLVFWFSLGTIAAWKAMPLLGFSDDARKWTFVCSALVPVYFLFSAAVLTEVVVFAMAMLGLYLTVRFYQKGGLWVPPLVALCFVAAAYTRLNFLSFQVLGWVPLVLAWATHFEIRNRLSDCLVAFALYNLVAWLFLLWPNNIPVALPSAISGIAGSGTVASTGGVSTGGGTPVASGTNGLLHIVYNTSYLFSSGIGGGFGPVPAFLIFGGFFMSLYTLVRKRGWKSAFSFSLGAMTLVPFLGTALIYSPAAFGLFLGTIVRYSYDAMPAFFVLAPIMFAKFTGKKFKASVIIGLFLYVAVVGAFSQPVLQSSLAFSYPFLSGNQNFLSPDYRTPMAQIRDYLIAHPPCGGFGNCANASLVQSPILILGEDPDSLDGNLTNLWRFTPGVSNLNVIWEPYSYGVSHHGTYFLWVPPDINVTKYPEFKAWPFMSIFCCPGDFLKVQT